MGSWHQQDTLDVLDRLDSDSQSGLSTDEIARRQGEFGPNELIERGLKSPWRILWEQLTATLVVVLIIAAVVSALLRDFNDAIAITAIIVLNALLGFRQEYKAEHAIAALKRLAVPIVKVRRNGHVVEVPAVELVPGDVVILEAGGAVPADGRLLENAGLRVQESALTGESQAAEKDAKVAFDEEQPLADRRNMVYMGTTVVRGRGLAVVTEVGMRTQLGNIATMIQQVRSEPTPLQRRLDHLGKALAVVALVLVAIVFALGMLQGGELKEMFMTAVSLAVAAVPEGLPAVVTIALAIGAQRMLRRNALIRKLPAVETLGSVTTICSDKTGTLTENKMTVIALEVAGQRVKLGERLSEETAALCDHSSFALLVTGGALCNDAVLEIDNGTTGDCHAVGDPTENALIVAAARFGLLKGELDTLLPRVAELPFDSDRKRMTTVHRHDGVAELPCPGMSGILPANADSESERHIAFTKGALDSVLDVSARVWNGETAVPLSESWRERIWKAHDELAGDGVRVLALAFRQGSTPPTDGDEASLEHDLVFVGLVGMIDPARPEAREAVETCRAAGIRPVMITGDHALTARYIARGLGIDGTNGVLTGRQLDDSSDERLEEVVEETAIYARVSPEHKLKLIDALQDRGHVVAMTGDGVNDAPALKQADIGVAMGITGTDVAKEAADAVLRDNNFATIVAAVKEGRIVYDNIRKFIKYTLTSNAGEIWVMVLAPLFGMPLPLLPLQILWVNLVTDGLPGLALALEPGEKATMRRGPYPPGESVFARGLGWDIVWIGLLMGVLSFTAGWWYWSPEVTDHRYWRTVVFTVLTLSQMGNALATRSSRDSLFRIGLFSNKAILGSVLLTFGLQLLLIYVPLFQEIFDTVPLRAMDLGICLLLSTAIFWAVEAKKTLTRLTH